VSIQPVREKNPIFITMQNHKAQLLDALCLAMVLTAILGFTYQWLLR
jgi:uncharacterized membrane protein (DUF373 family)